MSGGLPSSRSAPRHAARWWLLLFVILAVVVTGTVLTSRALLGEVDPKDPPPPVPPVAGPTTSSARTPRAPVPGAPVVVRQGTGPLLPGVGSGEVYAQSATGIYRLDLDTGQISRTATTDLEEHVTFLAGRGWVLVKSRWSPTGALVRDGRPATPLAHEFDREGFLHAAPGGRLWVEPEPGTDPTPTTPLQLAGLDGQVVPGRAVAAPRTAAPYTIVADGYGGLMLANRGGVYRLDPGPARHPTRLRLISRGDLVAAGGRRLLVWDCDDHGHCEMTLVDQRTGHRTARAAAARTLLAEGGIGIDGNAYGDAQLSPGGTHLAAMAADHDGSFRVHVVDLRTGQDTVLPGVGTDVNVNRQLAWSPNGRWLLGLTDHRIRAYDTGTHATRQLDLGVDRLLHLTAEHAPGW